VRILTAIDGIVKGDDTWLWRYLPQNEHEFDFVYVKPLLRSYPRHLRSLLYYSRYVLLGIKTFFRAPTYDIVVSWEAKCGLPFAFLQSVLHRSRPPHVILGFIGKNAVRKARGLCRFALRSVSKLVVYASAEVEEYEELFSMPSDRIAFIPLADFYSMDTLRREPTLPCQDYVFSVGSSNRDYGCLAEAVKGLDARMVVVGKKSDFHGVAFPDNVEVKYDVYGPAMDKFLRESRLVVIPLKDPRYSAGQTVLLKAMTFGKAVVVTETLGTADYVEDGKTAVLVEPGSAVALRAAIERLLDNPQEAESLGKRAQSEAARVYGRERFAQDILKTLENAAEEANEYNEGVQRQRRGRKSRS